MKEKKTVFFKATACNCFLKIQSFKRKRKVSPLSVLRFYLYIYQDIFKKKVICQAQGVVHLDLFYKHKTWTPRG